MLEVVSKTPELVLLKKIVISEKIRKDLEITFTLIVIADVD